MTQLLTFLLGLALTASVFAADFEGVTEFESYNIRGRYITRCITGKVQAKVHYCRAHDMHPFGWARISHNTTQKAKRLTLKVTDDSGKTITKKSGWSSKRHQSKKEFNLMKRGLFQPGLLKKGENLIEWELQNSGKTVESGEFTATVIRGKHLQCADLEETNIFESKYCEDSIAACTRYFEIQTDCVPMEE